jgi:hypothetical protein
MLHEVISVSQLINYNPCVQIRLTELGKFYLKEKK